MSGRSNKKLRKLALAGARQIEEKVLMQMDERFVNLIKPRPKWLPFPIYRWLMKQLINQP